MGTSARYVVQQGDTREEIAKKFKTTPLQIDAITGGQLWVGRVIYVTVETPGPSLPMGQVARPPVLEISARLNSVGSKIKNPAEARRNEFELQLRLALYMIRMDTDPNGRNVVDLAWRRDIPIVPWSPALFETFKANAKAKAEKFWSHRFRLWPPAGYPFFNWPAGSSGQPLGVTCSLSIDYRLSHAGSTHWVRCYRRGNDEVMTAALNSGNWTDAILSDQSMDLRDKSGTAIRTTSITLAHEVGHLLGLQHPVSQCSGEELKCYGDDGEASQIRNIMGAGDQVNRSNATPWLQRIEQHTGVPAARWTVHVLDSIGNPLFL
jgi:hypothetical protein